MSGIDGVHVIELAKITDYLLSSTHPVGQSKAVFFSAFGFTVDDPEAFMNALETHARMRPVVRTTENTYGIKREVRCDLTTPDDRNPCIVAVWLQPTGMAIHRLITAYPATY